jgi:hypothetical protein
MYFVMVRPVLGQMTTRKKVGEFVDVSGFDSDKSEVVVKFDGEEEELAIDGFKGLVQSNKVQLCGHDKPDLPSTRKARVSFEMGIRCADSPDKVLDSRFRLRKPRETNSLGKDGHAFEDEFFRDVSFFLNVLILKCYVSPHLST